MNEENVSTFSALPKQAKDPLAEVFWMILDCW